MEALIKKHEDFEKTLDTQEEKIHALDQFAQKLMTEGHYDSIAISSRRNAVLARYSTCARSHGKVIYGSAAPPDSKGLGGGGGGGEEEGGSGMLQFTQACRRHS